MTDATHSQRSGNSGRAGRSGGGSSGGITPALPEQLKRMGARVQSGSPRRSTQRAKGPSATRVSEVQPGEAEGGGVACGAASVAALRGGGARLQASIGVAFLHCDCGRRAVLCALCLTNCMKERKKEYALGRGLRKPAGLGGPQRGPPPTSYHTLTTCMHLQMTLSPLAARSQDGDAQPAAPQPGISRLARTSSAPADGPPASAAGAPPDRSQLTGAWVATGGRLSLQAGEPPEQL